MRFTKSYIIQYLFLLIIILFLILIINNVHFNLIRTGLGFDFAWLFRPASFSLAEHILPYSPSNSFAWALLVGWTNSLRVIFVALIFSTIIGISAGILGKSHNYILKFISRLYILIIRQTPLLLQLLFWYFVGFLSIRNPVNIIVPIINISNQGINIFGYILTPEFSSLIIGLSVFTGAYIAEIVRGGLNSVPKGQWEAYKSLGISDSIGLKDIIIPQALPAILPGLTSQYLNLAKNSTLAIAVGYADIYAVSDTVINQTGKSIEGFILLLIGFLFINLIISNIMEFFNRNILKNKA